MSNSKLVTYIWKGSKNNCNPRNHKIDRITIHHWAGNGTIENCCNVIIGRGGSVNYLIDDIGSMGLMIDEDLRAWTSNSPANDHRAVTIEASNNCTTKDGDKCGWTVSDKTLVSLIKLCTDICQRNGKKKLIWLGSKEKALSYVPKADEMVLTLHKWFVSTACPGPYLEGKMPYIAQQVTAALVPAPETNFRVKATHGCYTYASKDGKPPVFGPYSTGAQWTIEKIITYAGIQWGKVKGAELWVRMSDVTKV